MRSRIEEQERENFILLKVVKDRMENAKAELRALTTSEDDDTMKPQGGLHGSSV